MSVALITVVTVVTVITVAKCFLVPSIKKLVSYLEKVKNWEAFGYQLLPEQKEHLVEVATCSCMHCNCF